MKKVTKFFKQNWSIIGLILAFLIDNIFDVLKGTGWSDSTINLIKGIGAIVVAYYWDSPFNKKVAAKKTDDAVNAVSNEQPQPTPPPTEGPGAVIPTKGF